MVRKSRDGLITRIINNWPLRRHLGFFAFMPVFFCMGAGLEFLMINVNINNVNFYKVYSKRLAQESAKSRVLSEANIEELIEKEKTKLIEKLKETQENKDNKSD